ncbi:MAG: 4Fe-4S ferredoxin, partial [Chloroflexia bacterium]
MKAVSDGVLDVRDDGFNHQMYECLDCRACEAVCPSGVLYGRLIEPARYQVEVSTQRALHVRLLRWAVFGVLFADMRVFRRLSRAMWLYQRSGARAAIRRSGVLRLLGMERVEALAPELSRTHVVARGQVLPAEGERRHRVGLFTGCVMS